jgi:hypothetical protein
MVMESKFMIKNFKAGNIWNLIGENIGQPTAVDRGECAQFALARAGVAGD